MKKISILCLLLLSALMLLVGCKADPEAFNNIPTLRLGEPTDLLRTSVTLHGSLQTDHPGHIREYGFLFSSSIDFTSSDTQTIPGTDGSMADITASVSGLTIGETYFYALYATTGGEKMLSEVASVTMPTRSGATLSEVEVLDLYTPTLKARITDDGGSIITSVGFCWSTSPNPTIFTGEHEFATYDEESQSFTADLTKLKGRENYYVCAFAECDLTGSGDVSISYGETVELKLRFKPTVSLKEVAATAASLTFEITSTDAEEVRWMLLPESSLDLYEEVTAEIVLGSENKVEPNKTEEITVDDLEPETTYTIYAAAEKEGVAVLSQKLEITTAVDSEILKIYYISTDEQIVEPYDATGFGANIVSNTYEDGQGVILFDGPVTSIGSYAFRDCTGLTSITIPDRVTSIGGDAFRGCTGLTAFYGKFASEDNLCLIVDGVLNAFAIGCGATEYSIPDSVTSIGVDAFRDCTGLTSVTIPDSVTSIGIHAFSGCTGLTSITIPNSVTSIKRYAFYGCTSLISVTIPDSVTSIGDGVLQNCTGLTSITIPNSVTSIGWGAFEDCTGLTSVTIPDSVTSIGKYAFSGCTGLTSIAIGNSVTSIGNYAFEGCTGLTSVTIPDSVTSIGSSAFYRCTGLTSITIPDSVTSIGSSAFQNCTGLTSVTIPDSVTSIGHSAFIGCTGLTSVTIPDSVTSIGYAAFCGCKGLTSITIPDSVTSIGGEAFSECSSLTSITIPDSVTSIGGSAFRFCTGLTAFYGKFASEDNLCLIVDGVLNAFAIGCGATEYTIPDSVTLTGGCVFSGCTGLTSITIPDSVTSIGGWTFYRCTSLTSITIPDSVTSIGEDAFYKCTGLTSVTIGNGVTSIGQEAFLDCTSLTSVYCKPITPPIGYLSMFDSNASGRKIYVPNASVDAYKSAQYWSEYAYAIVGYDF